MNPAIEKLLEEEHERFPSVVDMDENPKEAAKFQEDLDALASKLAGKPVIVGYCRHECPAGPIGVCVYDLAEDPVQDDCVFCHAPHERK